MSNLQSRNNVTIDTLSQIQGSIEELKIQLEQLNQKFTDATKLANAQANLTKQWKESIEPLKALLKKACAVYGDADVLAEMVGDIQEMADEVANNFDAHKEEENEFLDGVKDKQPEPNIVALPDKQNDDAVLISIEESMPDVSDNETLLSENNALKLIEHLDKSILKKLALLNDLGNVSTAKSIAKKLAEIGVTRYHLEQDLERLNPQQSLPIAS